MAAKKSKSSPRKAASIEVALGLLVKRLADCHALRKGSIVIRARGPGGGDFCVDCSEGSPRLTAVLLSESPPTIEIMGDARQIQGVLAGQKDARKHFLAGGFRLRGDLRYFSDLAVELGILKEPL